MENSVIRFKEKPLAFDSARTAMELGVSEGAVRQSRMTGMLCGVKAPQYRKMGKKVVYLATDIQKWLSELPSFGNTAEQKGV